MDLDEDWFEILDKNLDEYSSEILWVPYSKLVFIKQIGMIQSSVSWSSKEFFGLPTPEFNHLQYVARFMPYVTALHNSNSYFFRENGPGPWTKVGIDFIG